MDYKEYTGKTVDEALTEALIDMGTTSDKVDVEVVEEGSSGFLGLGSKPATIRVTKKNSPEENAKVFLTEVLSAMGIETEIEITRDEEDDSLCIELKGKDMGMLIGKRGQTLDSLQYLTSLVLNKNSEDYVKIKLDTENYRERRKQTLENLTKNVSYKVKRTRRAVSLEPMNPFERRVIHFALQNDKYVTTHSEGEEPYRHLVISPKKDAFEGEGEHRERRYDNRRNGGYNKGRRENRDYSRR